MTKTTMKAIHKVTFTAGYLLTHLWCTELGEGGYYTSMNNRVKTPQIEVKISQLNLMGVESAN